MKKQVLLIALFFNTMTLLSAQRVFKGKVIDSGGESLVSASIVITGTNQGVITDNDGNFSIEIPKDVKTVTCSFVGYEKREITVKELAHLVSSEIILEPKSNVFDALVVTGTRANLSRTHCTFPSGWSKSILDMVKPESRVTKLTYKIDLTVHDLNCNLRDRPQNIVQYDIYKAYKDSEENYRKVGISNSDGQVQENVKKDSTQLIWGGSEFWDYDVSTEDTTYYIVIGFIASEHPEEYDKMRVFWNKIKVVPEKSAELAIENVNVKAKTVDLLVSSTHDMSANAMVVDMLGHVLLKRQCYLFKGHNSILLPCDDLIAGVYVLTVQQNGRLVSRKFVIGD